MEDKQVKVLFIITGLRFGGAEKLLYHICSRLDKKSFIAIVVYFDPVAPMLPLFQQAGIPTINIKLGVCSFFYLLKILFKERVDVIHTHLIHADLIGRSAAIVYGFFRRVKIFSSTHDSDWFRWDSSLLCKFVRRVDYWQALAANSRVLPVSEALRTMLIEQEKIPQEKIELLLNAIPIPAPVDRPYRQNSSSLSVLFVGRLTKQKNAICLVKAVELIRHLPVSVSIVGEGIEKLQLLKQVATSSLNGRITFFSPNSDIYQIFAKHDILVLPSLFEGLPMIILESFSAMLPVIGSDIPGNRELLSEDKGTLFPTDDCVKLAELLQQAYTDYGLFVKKAHTAYDYVRLHHNIDRYLKNLVNMYSTSNLR